MLALFMFAASAAAFVLTPNTYLWKNRPPTELATLLPSSFGPWIQEEAAQEGLVVDPQLTERLAQVYSETISRTYRNERGERIMLSVAYGRDQRGEGRTHYPEVCYPAQGFQIKDRHTIVANIGDYQVPLNRLVAAHSDRIEPVSYWLLVGDKLVSPGISHKLAVISYGIGGQVPDGLLFRLSSIDRDPVAAYERHVDFAKSLVTSIQKSDRERIFGTIGM